MLKSFINMPVISVDQILQGLTYCNQGTLFPLPLCSKGLSQECP